MYPQRGTTLFADGRSARPQVPGTVARSQGHEDDYRSTGMVDGKPGDGLPFKVSSVLLERGQERFNIYCSPCHSRVGNGKGMIVDRGYYKATSFHSERLRQVPLGYFFTVMTNGYGAMPSYKSEVTADDRWAIAAYIRALQLSQNARTADLPVSRSPERLGDIAAHEGFPANFLLPWGFTQEAKASEGVSEAAPEVTASAAPVATKAEAPLPGGSGSAVIPAGTHSASIEAHYTAKSPSGPAEATGAKTPTLTASAPGTTVPGATARGTAPAPAPAAKKGDAAAGKEIYANNCSVCHQPTRAGLPPVFPSLIGIVERTGPAHIRDTVRQGKPDAKPPMPAFTKFSPEDVDNLIEYLRTAK